MDKNPRSNYIQYQVRNRDIMANWLRAFGVPCLLLKLKREMGNPTATNQFSEVDKLVIAYGKQGLAFDMVPKAYDVFQIFLPIQVHDYAKFSTKFNESLSCFVPVDPRFTYSKADIVLFRENNYVFRFEIAAEPQEYLGITVNFLLRYIDKKHVDDKIHTDPDAKDGDQSKYW
jgi:hypothetical protein